jgi:hypothetical protein
VSSTLDNERARSASRASASVREVGSVKASSVYASFG